MPIWQLCANLLIPNCLRSNLSYSPLAALELYVNKVRTKKIPSGIKQKTLQELACFIDGWVEELKTTREPLVVWKYKNPYWFVPQRRKRKDLYDYLLSCKLEQITAVIKIVYGSTEESQKSEKLDKLNEIFNKDFYEIAFTSNILEIRKITIVYL